MNQSPPVAGFVIVDEAFGRLKAAGWSIGEAAFDGRWLVTGTNGENRIHASAPSQSEAWQIAMEQAEAVLMVRS